MWCLHVVHWPSAQLLDFRPQRLGDTFSTPCNDLSLSRNLPWHHTQSAYVPGTVKASLEHVDATSTSSVPDIVGDFVNGSWVDLCESRLDLGWVLVDLDGC